jgi:hypothetical protein
MKEALEQHGGFLPADAQPSKVLNPGDRAFDGPAALVAPQRTAVLSHVLGLAVSAMRGDQLDALLRQLCGQFVAVVGLVAVTCSPKVDPVVMRV